MSEANIEEGELQIVDDQNYIITDELFQFKQDKNAQINWRNISSLTFDSDTGLPCNLMDPTKEILQNIEDISYVDLNKERNTRWISDEGRKALTVM